MSWLNNDHYQPWVSFYSEAFAFAGISVIFMAVLVDKNSTIKFPGIIIFLLLLTLVPWIQFAGGLIIFGGDALLASIYLIGFLISILVGMSFVNNESNDLNKRFDGFIHCLWIVMFISVAIGFCQWLGVYGPLELYISQTRLGDRAAGNLAQANHQATLILIGIAAYWYAYERKVFGSFAFYFGIVFSTVGLILTQSRSGMLSAMVMAAFLSWKRTQGNFRLPTRLLVVWLVFIMLGANCLPYINDTLGLGAVRSLTQAEPVNQRWQMWQQVAYAVTQSPWFGYGWNQTPVAHAVGAQVIPVAMIYDYAHNFLIDILAWNGLPLGLLINGSIIYWLTTRMRASLNIQTVAATMCLLPMVLHSMLEYPFTYAYFIVTAGIFIGVVEVKISDSKTLFLPKKLTWLLYLSWLPVSIGICYEYLMVEEDFRDVRLAVLKIGDKSEGLESNRKLVLVTHLEALLLSSRQTPKPNMPRSDLNNLRETSLRFSFPIVHFKYALALALNNNLIELNKQMDIIRIIYGKEYYIACKIEIEKAKGQMPVSLK